MAQQYAVKYFSVCGLRMSWCQNLAKHEQVTERFNVDKWFLLYNISYVLLNHSHDAQYQDKNIESLVWPSMFVVVCLP